MYGAHIKLKEKLDKFDGMEREKKATTDTQQQQQ